VQVDEAIRDGLDGSGRRTFVHQARIPLVNAPERRSKQLGLFDDDDDFINECEGLCGI